jgi:hypothetical protein
MTENARTSSSHARARVRRVTGGVVLASITLAGTIAGYVSHRSGHEKAARGGTTASASAGPAAPSAPAAPSLLAPGESSTGQSQTISPPSQAPSAAQAPPVAVSGAS